MADRELLPISEMQTLGLWESPYCLEGLHIQPAAEEDQSIDISTLSPNVGIKLVYAGIGLVEEVGGDRDKLTS